MTSLATAAEALVHEEKLESPELQFRDYGIAVHFVMDPAEDRDFPSAPSPEIASFEEDMLGYAYRGDPPFHTALRLPPELSTVTASFPAELVYESEGRTVRLRCAGASGGGPRRRRFRLRASWTDFPRSSLSVLHVALGPDADPEASTLNEWDVIKLVKLWEGGEGLPGPGEVQGWLEFDTPEGAVPFAQLAERVARPDTLRQYRLEGRTYRVGTVQLLAHGLATDADQLLADIERLTKSPARFQDLRDADDVRWRRVRALGGIAQGLLDFQEIDAPELSEVFERLTLEGDQLLGFHKGTLISLAPSDRVWERTGDSVGLSPYLLLPQAVVLQNEERLKEGLRLADELELTSQTHHRLSSRALRDIQRFRLDIARIRDRQLLPQVFHYPQERELFDLGQSSRGLDDLNQDLGDHFHHSSVEVEDRETARQNADSFVIGLLLALIAAAQAGKLVPDAAVIAAIGTLGLGYFLWRYAS